ncbi:aminoglycoside phosphotransferase family protein [Methylopila musalis]|uniref:Aminoglycoside phosphotransferase family protein n=1 Tax=Methylopila musalis TaxID=1134781 RepID=A0ABW3Z5Q8_9HYPH
MSRALETVTSDDASDPPATPAGESEIGRGAQAAVYARADGRVVKRYFADVARARIVWEFRNARLAYEHGVPTWRPDALSEDGRSIVGQRVTGETLSALAARRPWRAIALMGELARIHAHIHRLPPPPGCRRWRRHVKPSIVDSLAPHLGPAAIERARDLLLASESGFCHGDLSPSNVLVDGGRLTVLDWGRSGVGPIAADVGRAYAFILCAAPGGAPTPLPLRLAYRFRLAEAYLAAYLAESGRMRAPIAAWAAVTLAAAASDARRTAPSRALAQAALERVAAAFDRTA